MGGEQKQMGCMAGFLQIFDRHQILAAKSLPPPQPEPDNCGASDRLPPLPLLEFKPPRLSLDSRALVDAKGALRPRDNHAAPADVDNQRRSTSVIARLMGLDDPSPQPELRRSASEHRAPGDLHPNNHHYRFFDTNGFQLKRLSSRDNAPSGGGVDDRGSDPKAFTVRNAKTEPARNRGTVQKKKKKNKSFYDSADVFPDAKRGVSIYGEIERRLKMRGIDEPSKDLDTLKQILEALQLKGLLHSKDYAPPTKHRNFVFDGNDSPIVVMKPARPCRTGRSGSDSPPPSSFGSSPRATRNSATLAIDHRKARNTGSPTRGGESGVRSPNRTRKVNDAVNRRVQSVNVNSRRSAVEQQRVRSRSPRVRRGGSFHKEEEEEEAEDASSTVSESSLSTSSPPDTERMKMEGRNVLERCGKLLKSIAEITAAELELQPSPVSVLDYKEEPWCSPSPVMKRCIDYKEEDMWSGALCLSREDSDFIYVSEILRASTCLPQDSDVFLLLEKQQCLKGHDTSKASTLRRRLIFDTIHDILRRNRRLPPWKEASWMENTSLLRPIWTEFRRIREREEPASSEEELFEVVCGVLRKDVAEEGGNEWGECPVEMGEVVLDMERLVFKDLIGETIRDLASFQVPRCNRPDSAFRRKLLF